MSSFAVEVQDVSFSYQDHLILTNVNLQIPEGMFLSIIGPNGGGKTTLLKIMMGLLQPNKGSVFIHGKKPEKSFSTFGYVPQNSQADKYFPVTTLETILTGAVSKASIFGKYPKKYVEKAYDLMEKLQLLPYKNAAYHSLSGGTAQKTLLARALITDPSLLFLDESLANIDHQAKEEIFSFLFSFLGRKTILMVTHDLQVAVEKTKQFLCVENRVTLMKPKDVCEHFALGLYHTPLQDHD